MTRPRIAITMGDPAGVGPEVCLQLLATDEVREFCTPIIFGDAGVLTRVSHELKLPAEYEVVAAQQWPDAYEQIEGPTVVDFDAIAAADVEPGHVSEATGRASYRYIEAAIDAATAGEVDAITTGPIHKEAIHAAGVHHPGHTEIFAAITNTERICMMLTCSELTCSFVTTHVGYRDVPALLSEERILEVMRLSREALLRMRGTTSPKFVVCALNPHAGEGGLFGDREEERIIIPAIEQARREGFDVEGPLPPDTAFLPARRRTTDCFVCMYHDQGHIPLKALAFDIAVNITLGLPIIRTSVDHGTALDIAWQGKAEKTSLLQAVKLAAQLARDKQA